MLSAEELMFLNCREVQKTSWEKSLESPSDYKEIQPVNPKGNQCWIFIGRTDAEAETLILCPPDVKNRLIGKDPDAGKDWRQEEKGTTEDKMVGWHHWLDGHEFEQAPRVGDGQGTLACCSAWGLKVRTRLNDSTELNWVWDILEDLGGWCAIVHGFAQSHVSLRNWTTTNHVIFGGSIVEIHLWDILNALAFACLSVQYSDQNHFYKVKLTKEHASN